MIKKLMILWGVLLFLFGLFVLSLTPGQIKKDNNFIENTMNPIIKQIENVGYDENNEIKQRIIDSILSKYNVRIYKKNSDIENDEKLKGISIPDKNSFILAFWRGEWNEYYLSWNKRYITNGYNWHEGINGFLIFVIIGLIPLIIALIITGIKTRIGKYKRL